MARPKCRRRVRVRPPCCRFGPAEGAAGAPVELALDELEALRLADLEGQYQVRAAQAMGVSRATFGRIVAAARRKVAEALVKGLGIRIEERCPLAAPATHPKPGSCTECPCPQRQGSKRCSDCHQE